MESFCLFQREDVVRHPLVQDIIKAYESYEKTDERRNRAVSRGPSKDDHATEHKKAALTSYFL